MLKRFLLIILVLFVFTGCVPGTRAIENQRNKLEKKALKYVEMKYGMTDAVAIDYSLDYSSLRGWFPFIYKKLLGTGRVALSINGTEFVVICDKDFSDNYQADEIKKAIIDMIIEPGKITNEYYFESLELSSSTSDFPEKGHPWLSGNQVMQSFFKSNQKYDGDIEQFLKQNEFNFDISILFKSERSSNDDEYAYYLKSVAFIDMLKTWFPDSNSDYHVAVVKDNVYDQIIEHLENDLGSYNWTGPSLVFCRIYDETQSQRYIQNAYANSDRWAYGGPPKPVVKISYFKPLDTGIRIASTTKDFELRSDDDFITRSGHMDKSILEADNAFEESDFRAIDQKKVGLFDYGIVNDKTYFVRFVKPAETDGGVKYSEFVNLEVDKSILPLGTTELFLMGKNDKDSYRGSIYFNETDDVFYCEDVLENKEFVLVYKKLKE